MPARQRSVLVVDDNHTFAMYLGLLLRRLGFLVLSAPSPQNALELVSSHTVDVIISEGRTDSFDGLALLHGLHRDSAHANMPVIIVATHDNQSDRLACLSAGAREFLTKPFTPGQLHNCLREFIRFDSGTRRYPRISLNHRVRVESSRGDEQLIMTSLSEGGAFIRHDSPLETGEEVTVHFPTPCGIPLPLRGHVLYNRQMFETPECIEPGFAIHFRPLPITQKKLLSQYIEHMLAGDLEPFTTKNDFSLQA